MIDVGSSSDVIFWEAFQQLKVEKKLVKPIKAHLEEAFHQHTNDARY